MSFPWIFNFLYFSLKILQNLKGVFCPSWLSVFEGKLNLVIFVWKRANFTLKNALIMRQDQRYKDPIEGHGLKSGNEWKFLILIFVYNFFSEKIKWPFLKNILCEILSEKLEIMWVIRNFN